MATDKKPWERAWSMEEMIQNADNWSLAGDVALLNTIQAFADNLLSKTSEVSDNIDNLLNGLDDVSLRLDISKNEFQSLRNTQFIESRVYEEDETLASKVTVEKVEEKELTEEEKTRIIRESVLRGINVIEEHYTRVPINESESAEASCSYKLVPKNQYADRPLPFVIGTEEWHQSWHVGLLHDEQDEPSIQSGSDQKSEDVASISSDFESQPKIQVKDSNSSSELDISNRTDNNSKPVANSTFNDSINPPEATASSVSSDEQIHDLQQDNKAIPTLASQSFADELAAKLGHVLTKPAEPEINTKPIQKSTHSNKLGDLFFDEPPPLDLDDSEDTILPKEAQSGLFSGGHGLFDDDNDEDGLFSDQRNKTTSASQPTKSLFDDNEEDVKFEIKPNKVVVASGPKKSSQVTKGLFDSDESSSDDEMFATKPKATSSNQSFLKPLKATPSLFADEPPALEEVKAEQGAVKKKPFGGVSILDASANVFKKNRHISSSDDESVAKEEPLKKPAESPTPTITPESTSNKKPSLFDDDDDLFKNTDLFSSKKFTSNLFDDDTDLFSSSINATKTTNLFDQENTNKFKSIFDDDNDEDAVNDKNSINIDSGKENDYINTQINQPNKEEEEKVLPAIEVQVATPKAAKIVSLFDSTPPPDQTEDKSDDEWDNRSDNEDNLNEDSLFNTQRSSLFDNEPPSLAANESSGIMTDASSNIDSSFYPFATSSRRLSSDLFNEQQSNDSFFVTKSSEVISEVDPNPTKSLDSILEITPSGDPNDFNDSKLESLDSANFTTTADNNDKDNSSRLGNSSDCEVDGEVLSEGGTMQRSRDGVPKKRPVSMFAGKLNFNLNINVNALKPGFVPPKNLAKAHSLEEPTEDLKKEVASDGVEVLQSITKDRPRIQVKRRPQTRKGRQELIRNSVADFRVLDDDFNVFKPDLEEVKVEEVEEKITIANPVESTLKDDLFPNLEQIAINPNVSLTNDTDKSLFESPESEDDLFKSDASTIKKKERPQLDDVKSVAVEAEKKNKSLFDDESDDDMFSSSKTKKPDLFSRKLLFADDDSNEEDDIFKDKPAAVKKVQVKASNTSSEKGTKTNIKKLENIVAIDDPLSSLLK